MCTNIFLPEFNFFFKVSRLLAENVITPSNLLESALSRVEKFKSHNAFITVTREVAEKQAKQSHDRYNSRKTRSELDGIPVAVKDNFCTKDIPTTCASKMLEHFRPTYNATVVERLYDAGAVLVGKTNLDQFAMGSGTVDSIYGPSKNVWGYRNDTDFHIVGGSSGGSSIAVAAGMCFG